MAIALKFVFATLAGSLLLPAAARADEACSRGEEGMVFGSAITVEGSDGAFRVLCRQGRLTAVPIAGSDAEDDGVDLGGPPVSIEGTAPDAGAGAIPFTRENDIGLHAAGVAGEVPAATITQSAAEATTVPSTLPPVDQRGDALSDKPGISAEAAAAARPGDAKSEARIAPEDGTSPEGAAGKQPDASPGMVRVPAAIVSAAREVLPGIAFKNVTLSKDGASTVYGLAGVNQSGRAVAIDVDQTGTVLRVDRQVGPNEVPDDIARLSKALVPDARVDNTVMSIRSNLQSFFVFSGSAGTDEDFALEIRSDGRSLQFVDPR